MSRSKSIQKLYDFLKLVDSVEKTPGFSQLLGLSHQAISSLSIDQMTFEQPTLKLRLPLTSRLYLSDQTSVALSTYLAIIDDITTWALVLSDPKNSRAGVSVSLQASRGPAASKHKSGDVVEISATASKIGRNLGFAQAEVRDESGELIFHGSHIKFLPMGFVVDFLLSYGWPLAQLYSYYSPSSMSNDSNKLKDVTGLAEAFETFRIGPERNSATFVATPAHASLGGPLHGGCQAILMELAATEVAKNHFECSMVTLETMQVEYHSTPKSKNVELRVEHITQSSNESLTLRVKLLSGDKSASVGILTFVPAQSPLVHARL